MVDDRVLKINQERRSQNQTTISIANFFDHYATEADTQIAVTEDDFTKAKQELTPSVSLDELRHYERVRNTFEGATKKPDVEGEEPTPKTMGIGSPTTSPKKRVQFDKRPTTNGSGDMGSTMNGSARFQNIINSATGGTNSDADDDYVIRTDKLSLDNDSPNISRPPSSKGKGKGKGRDTPSLEDGPGPAHGEDLYD